MVKLTVYRCVSVHWMSIIKLNVDLLSLCSFLIHLLYLAVEQHEYELLLENHYIYCLKKKTKMGSFILLGTFLSIFSSLFVCQLYVKLFFSMKKTSHQNTSIIIRLEKSIHYYWRMII